MHVAAQVSYLIFVLILAANIQNRDGAVDMLKAIRCLIASLRHLSAMKTLLL